MTNLTIAVKKLKLLGFPVEIVLIPLSNNNIYWTDYPYSYLDTKLEKNWFDNKYMIFKIFLDSDGKLNKNKQILIEYYKLNDFDKKNVLDIFEQYLPYNFIWNGDPTEYMIITFSKIDNKFTNNVDLTTDNTYPMFTINLQMNSFPHMSVNPLKINEISKLFILMTKLSPKAYLEGYSTFDINFILTKITLNNTLIKQIINKIIELQNKNIENLTINSFTIIFESQKLISDKRKKFSLNMIQKNLNIQLILMNL